MSERPKIVVLGSLNVDHTLRVPHLPVPGETLAARGALTSFGGKGANQAIAAARAGGDVTLIGCVGGDESGRCYLAHLRAEGVRAELVVKTDLPTGSAFIAVDDRGENSIIVHPGANHALEPRDLDVCIDVMRSAAVLLLQLECPLPVVFHAITLAAELAVPVFLNASPWIPAFLQLAPSCDTVIVNEHEAASFTGMTLPELQAEPRRALAKVRARQLIITCGGDSTLLISADQYLAIAPPKVDPVDTVGAGDAFAGALAVACASRQPLAEAIRFANAAGALATLAAGAQSSIPTATDILAFLDASAEAASASEFPS
jgi:ribokinase